MQKTSTIYSTVNGVTTRVQAVADGIFRVTHTKRGEFLESKSDIVPYSGKTDAEFTQEKGASIFTRGALSVHISDETGALSFFAGQRRLLSEPAKRPHTLVEKPVYINHFDPDAPIEQVRGVDGVRAYAKPSETVLDRTAYEAQQRFVFEPGDALYGLGSHEEGYGNLRGRSRLLYQHNLKAVVPVLVSTGGWGIVFNMGCQMAFHDDADGSYLWAECTDELDWYFFYGKDYVNLMEKYRLLTGSAPLLPKYALGYIQSKERYVTAEEMEGVADEYRRRGVGLDMLVLDWQSWPEGQWGYKTFDRTRFPDPKGFTDRLHEKNVRLMISVWPSMTGDKNGDRAQMLEKGYMLGNRTMYDAFNPDARALYWKQANEGLFANGIDAWWCDDSEPFESDWNGELKREPIDRARVNTAEAKIYLDPAKISLYSLYHSMGIYQGQRGVTSEKRVVNLTRSSYAGQHRYAAVTWSGDVSATWETLRRHIPEGLNFCATGEGYWSMDIGAFFSAGGKGAWFFDGNFDRGCEDLGYRELVARWMQFGALVPMMRAHGTGTPREIWRFGEKGEMFYDAIADAIRLRYHLVPYLYTLMNELHEKGAASMRVPALVFPEDKALGKVEDELMLGDVILAKPVTRPMYYLPESKKIEADTHESVYLPAGRGWYALNDEAHFEGGQTVTVDAPIGVMPLFVREGAILPWGADVAYTGELAGKPLEIRVYPGADGDFTLYDDAGDGYGYEQGEASRVRFVWNDKEKTLKIGARQGQYPGMPKAQTLLVHLAGGETKEIEYSGEEINVKL